jgi:hypothetical protein
MKINLKKLTEQKHILSELYSGTGVMTSSHIKKLKELVRFLEEVETDLELGGESIVELDTSRLEAIAEKNKWLNFYHRTDDI